jgi:hypothetical protein
MRSSGFGSGRGKKYQLSVMDSGAEPAQDRRCLRQPMIFRSTLCALALGASALTAGAVFVPSTA